MIQESDYLILGAGLTGLSAANELGEQAIVLERDERPGGLVRTENFGGYWFDHVVHLLHFKDPDTEARIRNLIGDVLEPCKPEAYIETNHGTTPFPIQTHLGGLEPDVVAKCLRDLAEVTYSPQRETPTNYEDLLLRTFGRGICDVFLLPYNRKMWRRPLDTLATADFTWNIARPEFEQVVRGAMNCDSSYVPYNGNGWYPRPPADYPVRGMEVLSRELAAGVSDLRVGHTVEEIDLASRIVTARHNGEVVRFRFREACLSTLPLPLTVNICRQAPLQLRGGCQRLTRNRVRTVTFSFRGPRPQNRGLWRYYADESVLFTRLIHMHEFDPMSAPEDGWGLMAEVTERAEDPLVPDDELISRVRDDLERVNAIPEDCEIIDEHVLLVNPAYVVFATENQPTIAAARQFLSDHNITPLGRYGRWEYSSMAQNMRDSYAWAEQARELATTRTWRVPFSA